MWLAEQVSSCSDKHGIRQLSLPTGDIAYRLLDYRPVDGERSGCEVTVLDANPHMLQEGKKRRKDSRGIGSSWYRYQ